MTNAQQKIADQMAKQALCSNCLHRNSCDRRPIDNAWRFQQTLCPKWEDWRNGQSTSRKAANSCDVLLSD